MGPFDDSTDPELGAACNRLAAWVEALPEGEVIDTASKLTERDLALILRRLHATRQSVSIRQMSLEELGREYGSASVPSTKGRGR